MLGLRLRSATSRGRTLRNAAGYASERAKKECLTLALQQAPRTRGGQLAGQALGLGPGDRDAAVGQLVVPSPLIVVLRVGALVQLPMSPLSSSRASAR